jgi:hypothetical protein
MVLVTPGNSDGLMHPYGVRLCRSCARRTGVAF